ncbi:MAG: hypothetical protein HYW10_02995 [Candidatus Omnitrophica bacterium]|nr:hypothetical protein [Candidatus Omnitrophota bacterium]
MKTRRYYPIFADLSGRRCVVVGGGDVAQRKTVALLGCGARVTVVSSTLTRRLSTYARQGRIRHLARRFRPFGPPTCAGRGSCARRRMTRR